MSLSYDEVDELDASFAELLDDDCTDVTAPFQLPDPSDDALEFDLQTPSRWSDLPRLARPSLAPEAAAVRGPARRSTRARAHRLR
ncbi:MAG: hypothetical protein EPO40_09630 [Myxococcaceae bacterium]|nr:MAG: hypothetical protein EPO40_09630 [Myxococcaceae bacterium]